MEGPCCFHEGILRSLLVGPLCCSPVGALCCFPVGALCFFPVGALCFFLVGIPCCFPIGIEGTVLAYLAAGTFSFNLAEVALGVPLLSWTFSVRSALICSRFSLCVGAIPSSLVLAACFTGVPFCSILGALPLVSCLLVFFSACVGSFSSLLEEVSS